MDTTSKSSWRMQAATLLLLTILSGETFGEDLPETIRVMTFNMWHGGDAGGQPLSQSAKVIQMSKADLVGLQETAGVAKSGPRPDRAAELAKMLGWHYVDQGGRTGIICRYPIINTTPHKWGAEIQLPSKRSVYLFNAHFAHAPYQPYQLLGIPYHNGAFLKTEQEAIRAAESARGAQVKRMLAEIKAVQALNVPIFVTGDFNEPSHLDWTQASVKARLSPIAVQWPSTKAVVESGFFDGYRAVHPDPVKKRGLTWTPLTKETDLKDRHDRIDFVLCSKKTTQAIKANVVGESSQYADIPMNDYPSDHRAVVIEVKLSQE